MILAFLLLAGLLHMAGQDRAGHRARTKTSSREDGTKDTQKGKALIRTDTWVRQEPNTTDAAAELQRPRIGSAGQLSNNVVDNKLTTDSCQHPPSHEHETTVTSESDLGPDKTEKENTGEMRPDSRGSKRAQSSDTEYSDSDADVAEPTGQNSGASDVDDREDKASAKDAVSQDITVDTWKVVPKVVKTRSLSLDSKQNDMVDQRAKSPGEHTSAPQDPAADTPRVFGEQATSPDSSTPEVTEAPRHGSRRNRSGTLEGIASNFLERVDRTENENRKLLEDNERLLDSMKFVSEHEKQLIAENDSLRTDNNDLRDRLHNVLENNEELSRKISDLNQDIKQEKQKMENDKQAIQRQIDDLRAVSSREKLQQQDHIREIQIQHDKKVQELQNNFANEKSRLKEQLRNVEGLGAAKRNELRLLQADRKALQDQVKDLQCSRDKLLRDIDDRDSEREESLQALRTELESFQDRFIKLKKDHEEEVKKSADLEEQVTQQDKEKADSVRKIDQLREENHNLHEAQYKAESSQSSLRTELFNLKTELQAKEDQIAKLKEKLSEVAVRADSNEETRSTLDSLVREKQSHIDDLKQELWELRSANRNYVKEIERLDQMKSGDSVQDAKYEEMSLAHKKLLEENKHLRTLIAHKSMAETNTEAENADLKDKLEKLSKKLEISAERVRKLEQWMDEIYNNEEFQGALRDDVSTTFSTTSLPNIALSETLRLSMTGRKSVQRGKYFKSKKAF